MSLALESDKMGVANIAALAKNGVNRLRLWAAM
jgi:hypothetical protein